MSRIGLYTGSFDPLTVGHMDIIARASHIVDELIVAVGRNASKATMLSPDVRADLLKKIIEEELDADNIKASSFSHLAVDFAKAHDVSVIIRGLRDSSDLNMEVGMAGMNFAMNPNIETIFLFAKPEHSFISSSLVRQIYQMDGDISQFVPKSVLNFLKKRT